MKKKLSVLGIVVGIAFVVVGLLSMFGALGGNTSYPGSAPYSYDSGYATFGADYYTYSVNNSAEAAAGARTAAYNIGDLAEFLKLFCGLTSVLFGVMVICGFGIVIACDKKSTLSATVANEANTIVVDETHSETTVAE